MAERDMVEQQVSPEPFSTDWRMPTPVPADYAIAPVSIPLPGVVPADDAVEEATANAQDASEPTQEDAAAEEKALRKAYRKQVRNQQLYEKVAAEMAEAIEHDDLTELERSDTDDLFDVTEESPEDELERTDLDDVLGLSEKDEADILGVGDLGEGDEDALNDVLGVGDDFSDILDVSPEDVMGTPPMSSRKHKRVQGAGAPPMGGIRGVR